MLFTAAALVAHSGCAAEPTRVVRIEQLSADGLMRGFMARINLADPRLVVHMTGPLLGDDHPAGAEARLTTTDQWALDQHTTLALNGNFFGNLPDTSGTPRFAEIIGLSISDGAMVSPPREFRGVFDPALVIRNDQRAEAILAGPTELFHASEAVAGVGASESDPSHVSLLVEGGINRGAHARVEPEKRHPRTAAGVSRDGHTLWLVAIDGGGSTAFVYEPSSGPSLINRPRDGAFRPVANHLGFSLRGVPAAVPVSTASAPVFERE